MRSYRYPRRIWRGRETSETSVRGKGELVPVSMPVLVLVLEPEQLVAYTYSSTA